MSCFLRNGTSRHFVQYVCSRNSWTCFRGNSNQAWDFNQNPAQPTQFKFGTSGKCIGVAQPMGEPGHLPCHRHRH